MKWSTTAVAAVMVVCLAVTSLLAHEYTFKGTVIGVQGEKLKVSVRNLTTKKLDAVDFILTADTKILRDDKLVTLDGAKIKKAEPVAVTINNDEDTNEALVVRLGTSK